MAITGCQQNSHALPRASLPAGSWALLGVWVALLALTLGLGSSCPSSEEAEHEKATHAGEGAGGSLGTQTRRGGVLAADAKGPELCAGPDNLPFLGPSSLTERRRPTECVSFIERLLGKGSETLSWRFPQSASPGEKFRQVLQKRSLLNGTQSSISPTFLSRVNGFG